MPPKLESSADEAAMLALNRAHIAETSALEAAELRSLLAQAFHVGTCARGREAFLIALDQDATYSSPNFQWSSRVTSASSTSTASSSRRSSVGAASLDCSMRS